MMAHYVTRPRALYIADDDEGIVYDGLSATASTILSAEDDFIETGLLDAEGEPLYRQRGRIRLGFADETP